MNPRKSETLKTLDEAAKVHDAALHESIDIATHPERHGWSKSLLTAAVVVPLTGISAIVNDLSRLLIANSDDDAWDRKAPPSDGAE